MYSIVYTIFDLFSVTNEGEFRQSLRWNSRILQRRQRPNARDVFGVGSSSYYTVSWCSAGSSAHCQLVLSRFLSTLSAGAQPVPQPAPVRSLVPTEAEASASARREAPTPRTNPSRRVVSSTKTPPVSK